MLADSELEAIARSLVEFETRRGGARAWWAQKLAKDVPGLLRHIQELTAERDEAQAFNSGIPQ